MTITIAEGTMSHIWKIINSDIIHDHFNVTYDKICLVCGTSILGSSFSAEKSSVENNIETLLNDMGEKAGDSIDIKIKDEYGIKCPKCNSDKIGGTHGKSI